MFDFRSSFQRGLSYRDFLSQYGSGDDAQRWSQTYDLVSLSALQTELLAGFRRKMQVLCMAGAWCGDCAAQCPILFRFVEACQQIDLRFVDRDENIALANELMLCGSPRVPQVVFMDEEGNHVARFGDRTLAKYRQMNAQLNGASCPSGIATSEPAFAAVVQDWLNEFERVQHILRTSPRLRTKHGD